VIEDQEVGQFSRRQATGDFAEAAAFCGCEAGHPKAVGQIGGRVLRHVADHVIHAFDGACEATGGCPADISVAVKRRPGIPISEDVVAWWQVECAIAVCHEAQAVGAFHAKGEFQEFGGEVAAIGNHFGAHVSVHQDEFGHAALHGGTETLAQRRHGAHSAPEVIHVSHSGFEGGLHFRPAGIGMTAGDEAASSSGCAVEIGGAREFRSAGRDAYEAGREPGSEIIVSGRSAGRFIVAARLVLGEVGTIQMHAGNGSTESGVATDLSACGAAGLQHLLNVVVAAGGGCGKQRGGTVMQMSATGGENIGNGGIHEI